jgi:chromosome segregation ATPase
VYSYQPRHVSEQTNELKTKLKEVSRQAASEHNNDMERTRAAMQEAMAQRDDSVKDCALAQQNLDTIKAEVAGLKQRVAIKDARIAKLEQSKISNRISKPIVNKMNKIKDDNKRMKKILVQMDSAYAQLQEEMLEASTVDSGSHSRGLYPNS